MTRTTFNRFHRLPMILIAILGLLLPGYLLARAFRSPFCWAAAFPLSALLVAEIVIAYTILGVPLRFTYVLDALVVISFICLGLSLGRRPEAAALRASEPEENISKLLVVLSVVLMALVLSGLAVRSFLFPLTGYDTAIRWDLLARLMLKHEGLSYYPPRTADDFIVYPSFPDSFPPLVSSVYWWLYAAWGKPWPAITSLPVVLQAISCFALVFHAASMLFGRAGGWLAVAILATTTAFLTGIEIGQETGYTALSFAGQFAFALAATRQPRAGHIVMAGLFAALGALTREYGPLLCVAGFAILACDRAARRYLPLFCLIAALFGGAWYVRTWILTGNPEYPLGMGFGPPSIPVYSELLEVYRQKLGIQTFTIAHWLDLALELLIVAPLAMLIGVPSIYATGRRGVALAIAAAVMFFVWLGSVPYTTGGTIYSFRVLTPAFVGLSVAGGALGRWLSTPANGRSAVLQRVVVLAIFLCGAYAAGCCWAHPYSSGQLFKVALLTRDDPLEPESADVIVAKGLEETDLPAMGVLTDSGYLAVALERYSRFHPIVFWNPSVAFVFDRTLDLREVRRRLREQNIRLISSTDQSFNNYFLIQFALFHDYQAEIRPILEFPKVQKIFRLFPESQAPADVGTPQP